MDDATLEVMVRLLLGESLSEIEADLDNRENGNAINK